MRKVFALFAVIAAAAFVSPAGAAFTPGDMLLSTFNPATGLSIQQYTTTGTLVRTFTYAGTRDYRAVGLTPDGNLATIHGTVGNTSQFGLTFFSPEGDFLRAAPIPGATQLPYDPGFFANGSFVINDTGNNALRLYTRDGVFTRAITLPSGGASTQAMGNAVAPDDTIWAVSTVSHSLVHYNQQGTQLSKTTLAFEPRDLMMNPNDGTLWLTDYNGALYHFTASGLPILGFNVPTAFSTSSVGWAGDGTLWVSGSNVRTLYHIDQSGVLLGSFSLPTGTLVGQIVMVPVPEPAGLAMMGAGLATMLISRRRNFAK